MSAPHPIFQAGVWSSGALPSPCRGCGGVGWGGERGSRRRCRPASTHPPRGIKVALGQGLVIVGVRVREGPLSHDDAAREPAEQGKRESSQGAPGLRAGTPTRRRDSGSARSRDGGRGSEPRGSEGEARFPPTSHAHESAGCNRATTGARTPPLRSTGLASVPDRADNNRRGAFPRPLPVGPANQRAR